MYGDRSLPKMLSGVGPRGQYIPNHSVNLEHYVTKAQFRQMLYDDRLTMKQIAEKVGYPHCIAALSRIVRRIGWKTVKGKMHPYHSNDKFFEQWTCESAWVYGWLITDGHVNDKSIAVRLQKRDEDVVEKIKHLLQFDGGLYKYSTTSEIRIYNKRLVESLRRLGVPKRNKTFDCEFPHINDDVAWDFLREVFEGDGNVSVSRGGLRLSVCGASLNLMDGVRRFLEKHGIDVTIKVINNDDSKTPFYVLTSRNMPSALRWAYFMYKDTGEGIRMDRKHDKISSFVEMYYTQTRPSRACNEALEQLREAI